MESIKQKVPQIKICGITQDEEIQWLNEADVSYAGFVLYEKSCRYIPISKTQELFEKLNDNKKGSCRSKPGCDDGKTSYGCGV